MKKRTSIVLLFVAVILLMPVSVLATSYSDSATVYVSLTNDSEFVTANDGTVLAQVPITVDYFDLAEYGLEGYYRYQDVDGHYVAGAEVLKSPTLLHCFIRLLEKYYVGRKLTPEEVHSDIINVTGYPTSSYLTSFWGHDENIMYQVNHDFEIMSGTTLATCDYIVLEGGDEINIGMFTDWNFHKDGAFAYFTKSRRSAYIGEEILLEMRCRNTMAGLFGDPVPSEPMHNETIRISSDCGKTWNAADITTDDNGECRLSFERAGTYYISAGPSFNTYPFIAPPICIVYVTEKEEPGPGPGPGPDPEDPLAVAKAQAKSDLAAYKDTKDPALYRDEQKQELIQIFEQGNSEIEAAQTVDDVAKAFSEAKAALDAVKTDAQITEEEKQKEEAEKKLAEAKASAKTALDLYRAPSEYRDAEKALLTEILEEGRAAIDAAETEDAVKALLAEYKGRIDELKTDAQYTAEEEAAREEEERKQKEHEAEVRKAKIKAAKGAKSVLKVRALKKHKAKVTWKKVRLSYTVDGQRYACTVTGYKIYRAAKKAGKYKLIKTIRKAGTLKYTDKKPKKGKKYYYKVRTYTRIDGETYLSKWSKARKITAK